MKSRAVFSYACMMLVTSCTLTQTDRSNKASELVGRTDVTFPVVNSNAGTISLWSTQYVVHVTAAASAGGVPLIGRSGQNLGVQLSRVDWCNAAMEGTTAVGSRNGSVRIFNYAGMGAQDWTNCDDLFPKVKPGTKAGLRRSTFMEVTSYAPDGLGVGGYRLVPFRTVAVDPKVIKIGTVLFIPKLRGVTVQDDGGVPWVHDGYVFAADVGGEIKGNHIDFFTGRSKNNPAPEVVTSSPALPFEAQIINDPQIAAKLKALHSINNQ